MKKKYRVILDEPLYRKPKESKVFETLGDLWDEIASTIYNGLEPGETRKFALTPDAFSKKFSTLKRVWRPFKNRVEREWVGKYELGSGHVLKKGEKIPCLTLKQTKAKLKHKAS